MPMKKSLRSLEKVPPPKKPNHLSTNSPLHGLSFARPVQAIFFPKPPLSRRRCRTWKRLSKRGLLKSPFSSLPPLKKNLKTLESVKNMLLSTFSCWSALSPHNAFSAPLAHPHYKSLSAPPSQKSPPPPKVSRASGLVPTIGDRTLYTTAGWKYCHGHFDSLPSTSGTKCLGPWAEDQVSQT